MTIRSGKRTNVGVKIIVAKAGRPSVGRGPMVERTASREFGFMAGQVCMTTDFDEALPDEIMEAFAGDAF